MTIVTGRGDGGTTSLFGGARVPKDDPRVEAYGAVDELVAWIGLLAVETGGDTARRLQGVQSALMTLAAVLADPGRRLAPERRELAPEPLEAWIRELEGTLEPLGRFILPGGTRAAAVAHVARTVCRRAERRVTTLARRAEDTGPALVYLNRLSDLLFLVARAENAASGVADPEWTPPGG